MSNNSIKRRFKNEVNAGSMADIAFLLLIFFLVTTQIVEEQGILVKLPSPALDDNVVLNIPSRNVLTVKVNAEGKLLVEGEILQIAKLRKEAKLFILNPTKRTDRPSSPRKAIVSLQNDRKTDYKVYLSVYNELQAAYREMREATALEKHNKGFHCLNTEQRNEIKREIPLIISEAEPTAF